MVPTPAREHQGRTIVQQIPLEAPPEVAYAAWADPAEISQWFVDRMEGEPRAGGVIWWVFEHFQLRHPIAVLSAEPGRELVFGGELPGRPRYLQEFLFEPDRGGTLLTLRNSGFGDGPEWDDEFAAVESGWVLALATLKHWLEHHRGAPRQHRLQMRPAVYEFEALQPFLASAGGLERWLTRSRPTLETPLAVGASVALDLDVGLPLHGKVLARTAREVLLEWPQQQGVLGLKCFTMYGEQRALCLDVNTWGAAAGSGRALDAWMTRSLNRLGEALAPRRG